MSVLDFLSRLLSFVEGLFNSISDFVEWIGLVIVEIFKSLFILLTDLIVWGFENLFSLAASLLEGVSLLFDISGLTYRVTSLWSAIPPEMLGVLNAIGVSSALAIIATGILIRFALQLIPFVRLGS